MKTLLLFLAAAAITFTGCRQSDIRPFTINLPGLKAEADQDNIRKALSPLPGVDMSSLVFDYNKKTLTLKYESMSVAHKNIEIAIAEAGYDANEIRAKKAK